MSEEKKDMALYDVGTRMLMGKARIIATSQMIPANYRNKEDCFVALHLAKTLKIDPIWYMQNTQPVMGIIGWKSPTVIHLINTSPRFKGGLRYNFTISEQGEILGATAYIREKETGEIIKGTTVTREMVIAEGWMDKKGSKWKTMPEQMYKYRAATFFARTECPEVLGGLYSQDEIVDMDIRTEEKTRKEKIDFQNVLPLDNKQPIGVQMDIEGDAYQKTVYEGE